MDAIECIKTRSSIREYQKKEVDPEILKEIIRLAVLAPSGKNGQPWKFKIVCDSNIIMEIAKITPGNFWIQNAPSVIVMFLDTGCSYNLKKDIQSCGAAMQNILLAINAMGLGGCWVGGVLSEENLIKELLNVSGESLKFMALVTIGYPTATRHYVKKKSLESFLL